MVNQEESSQRRIAYPVHEITDDHLPNGVYDILRASGGYFVGNILLDAVQLPHMGLSNSLDSETKAIKEFEERVVQNELGTYALHKDQPMLIIAKMLAQPRPATLDEIMHDVDHFGEQVWWPKDFYAEKAGVAVDAIDYSRVQTFQFPKGSLFGDEEFIYVGPTRWSSFVFSTFIDQHPLRVPLDKVQPLVNDLYDDKGAMGEGGYIVALSQDGVTAPLKYVQENSFSTQEVNPRSFEQIRLGLSSLNKGLQEYLHAQKESVLQHKKTCLAQHKKEQPGLFNFSEDGSMSSWYNF
jgi:hypothetical protein